MSEAEASREALIFLLKLAALAVGGLGILFAYLKFNDRLEKKRTKQLAGIASDLKLSFNFQESIWESISLGIFDYGCARNMMHGETGNAEVAIFDHLYVEATRSTASSHGSSRTYKQTAIYFKSTNLKLPRFTLSPKKKFHPKGTGTRPARSQDIDFPTHPEFSKRFLLRGENETRIRHFFTDKLLNILESQQKITVEGEGDQLVLYCDKKRVRPENWPAFMDEGFQIFDELLVSDQKNHSTT